MKKLTSLAVLSLGSLAFCTGIHSCDENSATGYPQYSGTYTLQGDARYTIGVPKSGLTPDDLKGKFSPPKHLEIVHRLQQEPSGELSHLIAFVAKDPSGNEATGSFRTTFEELTTPRNVVAISPNFRPSFVPAGQENNHSPYCRINGVYYKVTAEFKPALELHKLYPNCLKIEPDPYNVVPNDTVDGICVHPDGKTSTFADTLDPDENLATSENKKITDHGGVTIEITLSKTDDSGKINETTACGIDGDMPPDVGKDIESTIRLTYRAEVNDLTQENPLTLDPTDIPKDSNPNLFMQISNFLAPSK